MDLPSSLNDLRALADNLRWSWHHDTWRLFADLDPDGWRRSRHNPVRLLADAEPKILESATRDADFAGRLAALAADLNRYLDGGESWWTRTHGDAAEPRVAYFSAEYGITECLRIFAGGLGVLAGDHLKSASDLGVPLTAVGLFYREGYFEQEIDDAGRQLESYVPADPATLPLSLEVTATGAPLLVTVPLAGRSVQACVWRADVGRVPLYLLDTNVPENPPDDRRITDRLYGGDREHRLKQEIVLGIGGVRALRALGHTVDVVHLNEGHAAFAAVERIHLRLQEVRAMRQGDGGHVPSFRDTAQRMASGVVFTTHTPVPAGHDYFAPELLEAYLGGYVWDLGEDWDHFLSLGRSDQSDRPGDFCMTILALNLAERCNGVSRLHGAVSRHMWRQLWPGVAERNVPISHVTNGVHLPTWTAPPMVELYDRYLGTHWMEEADEFRWHRAAHIPLPELWRVRCELRQELVEYVRGRLGVQAEQRGEDAEWTARALHPDALTIVFARRFATYKRATLLLTDPDRLARLLDGGRVQFIFAGKAHPKDEPGKGILQRIVQLADEPAFRQHLVFLDNYDVELARHLVRGADVWLNVPRRPHEASGTSGMKAAANGALNLSIPDGWWAEAWELHNHLPEPIGWSIDSGLENLAELTTPSEDQDRAAAAALLQLLEDDVVPLFQERDEAGLPTRWLERVRASIRQVVPYFSTHRMVRDYVSHAYLPAGLGSRTMPAASIPPAAVVGDD